MQLSLFPSRDQSELVIGLLSLFLSALFLALGHFIGFSHFHTGAFDSMLPLLPVFFVVAAAALALPFVVRWGQRRRLAWLLLPVAVLLLDALIFRLNCAGEAWCNWPTRWPILPIGVGMSLYVVYFVGRRWRYLLLASTAITSSGLLMLAFFLAFLEGSIYGQPYVPALLYLCGIALVLFNVLKARTY